jgi:hypothetical protein
VLGTIQLTRLTFLNVGCVTRGLPHMPSVKYMHVELASLLELFYTVSYLQENFAFVCRVPYLLATEIKLSIVLKV